MASQQEPLAKLEERLEKLGTRLKQWESRFETENGRQPTKADVETRVRIKEGYERYGVLRKQVKEIRRRQQFSREKAEAEGTLYSPNKRGAHIVENAVAASPELKRKRNGKPRTREIPGTPEQPFILKRRRFAIAASPLVGQSFRRTSTSGSGPCSTPERRNVLDDDAAIETPERRYESSTRDEIGASPIVSESAKLGVGLRSTDCNALRPGVSRVPGVGILPRHPGDAIRGISSRPLQRTSQGARVLAGAALGVTRMKRMQKSTTEVGIAPDATSSRRAALLASPTVASPLKDSSNIHSPGPRCGSPYASPISHSSSDASGIVSDVKIKPVDVKKNLFGGTPDSLNSNTTQQVAQILRGGRRSSLRDKENAATMDTLHSRVTSGVVIPASPEAPRRTPPGLASVTTSETENPSVGDPIQNEKDLDATAPVGPAVPPRRRELNNNFVKLDLRKNNWRDKKKGGSGRIKAQKEMFDMARGSFAAPSEATEHGAPSSISSQYRKTAQRRDALDEIVDHLIQDKSTSADNDQASVSTKSTSASGLLTSALFGPSPATLNAPLCTGHQLPAVLMTTKKAGKNRGRQFYACSVGRDGGAQSWRSRGGPGGFGGHNNGGCKFFMWADDQPDKVAEELAKPTSEALFEEECLSAARARYMEMSVVQLKEALKHRGESVAGKKEQLVDRLIVQAASEFDRKDAHAHIFQEMDPVKGPAREDLVKVLQEVFGFDSFRGDQLWAIKRIMQGESTLLVQGTGSGKSLCYQLPALLLPGLTLVISPLVALMEDQMRSLPLSIPGAMLSHQQTGREMARTIKLVQERRIKVLFLSPERLFSSSFQRMLRTPNLLPEISLVCVDEAHCISSWSHNFRPAFLRLRELLASGTNKQSTPVAAQEHNDLALLQPRCVLGLTATATAKVANDICTVLGVDPKQGLKCGTWLRKNLNLSAELIQGEGESRFKRLLALLEDENSDLPHKLGKPASVIVYVRTKNETELVAEKLRSYNITARAYHGSMSGNDRSNVQSGFMKGTFRVVVATVAFGMGIDKSNIRGVVHMGMPRSIEDYVQEVGRAGRDGQDASCICMYDEADAMRLHSLAHAEGVDGEGPLYSLLQLLASQRVRKQVPLRLDELALQFDMKEAVLETLIVYLSLPPFQLLQLLPSGYASCKVTVLRSRDPSGNDSLLQAALSQADAEGKCSLADVAESQGMSIAGVIRGLSLLQDRRVISLTFSDPALFVRARNPDDERWDKNISTLVSNLSSKAVDLECLQVGKIDQAYGLFSLLGANKKEEFQTHLHTYFGEIGGMESGSTFNEGEDEKGVSVSESSNKDGHGSDDDRSTQLDIIPFQSVSEGKLRTLIFSDLKTLMRDNAFQERVVSGRVLARILHGISSPCYPYVRWKSNPFWGKWKSHRFDELQNLGDKIMREIRLAQVKR